MTAAVSLTDIPPASSSPSEPSPALTLSKIMEEFEQWRIYKTNPAEPIPDHLWKKIFTLAKVFPLVKLRALFSITAAQYNRKLQALGLDSPTPPDPAPAIPPVALCEVKSVHPLYQPQKLTARPTMVVELCRADGQVMKIHTTTDNFKTLMSLFFGEENPHAAILSHA